MLRSSCSERRIFMRGRYRLLQKGLQLSFGLHAHGHIHGLAVPEEQQSGDGGDLVPLGKLGHLVYVHLAEGDLRMLLSQLLHYGGEHGAGPAPCGPEVHEDGGGSLCDLLVEIL